MSQVKASYKPEWPRSKTDCAKRMAAFDKLPKTVRDALNDSDYPFCPHTVLKEKRRLKLTAHQMVGVIKINEIRVRGDA